MTPAEKLAAKHNAEVAAKAGHNSDPSGRVREFVDRLVNLEGEKRGVSEDIKELKAEAKGVGLDPKALATLAKHRMEDDDKRAKRLALEETVDRYKHALGILD